MEKTVKFEQYKLMKEHALAAVQAAGVSLPEAGSMNPVLLAYVGDVVFRCMYACAFWQHQAMCALYTI